MKKILVIGEILVEIMADTIGDGFDAPQPLTGPFPSGAPAIFADQVAKLGHPVGIVSAIGNDDFGRINVDRLSRDGVDCTGIATDDDRPTGSAFVRYRADGSRDFVFNIKYSACGHLNMSDGAQSLLGSADHLHVMGSSLSSAEFADLNIQTAEAVKQRGGTVSFDPNLRKEILDAPGISKAMARILALTAPGFPGAVVPSGPWKLATPARSIPSRAICRTTPPPKQYPMAPIRPGSVSG